VARGAVEFLQNLAGLAELQERLLIVDLKEGSQRLLVPALLFGTGLGIAAGCVPVAIAALALTLNATTDLSLAASFWISLLMAIVLAAALAVPALVRLKTGLHLFDRSYAEWRRNFTWVKDTLQRAGRRPFR
jgi:hypothetical protein